MNQQELIQLCCSGLELVQSMNNGDGLLFSLLEFREKTNGWYPDLLLAFWERKALRNPSWSVITPRGNDQKKKSGGTEMMELYFSFFHYACNFLVCESLSLRVCTWGQRKNSSFLFILSTWVLLLIRMFPIGRDFVHNQSSRLCSRCQNESSPYSLMT